MSGRWRTMLCLAGWLAAALPCAGQLDEAALRELLEAARLTAGAPGAILAVQVADRPAVIVATGYLDLARTTPITPEQPFFLGSVSKSYTAAVVLRLAEEGRLSLDDRLARWLPDLPRGGHITLRQLLDHAVQPTVGGAGLVPPDGFGDLREPLDSER